MPEKRKKTESVLAYKFDNFMSGGPRAIFLALFVTFILFFVFTAILRMGVDFFLQGTPLEEVFGNLWLNFLQITDAGAIAENTESPFAMKVVGILTMVIGLIFFSALVAFITTQLDAKIIDLRKGRSAVAEKDHVLILGWGNTVVEIIKELIIAHESEKRAAVVVLSELAKEEMDDYFAEHLPVRKTTRIVTRSGNTSSMESLRRVGILTCKSVIVLPLCSDSADEEEKSISDSRVLKTLLACIASTTDDPVKPHIVAEIFDPVKKEVMQALDPDNITMVETGRMIAKIIVQTSRTSGLAYVYNSLVGFSGSEMYFYKQPWDQIKFADIKYRLEDGIPMGVRTPDKGLMLNPPGDYRMGDNDELVVIAEDDSTIRVSKKPLFSPVALQLNNSKVEKTLEKELIIGWNTKAPTIIEEYHKYILEGSVIDLVLTSEEDRQQALELARTYPQIQISILDINPLNIEELRTADLDMYHNVIILNPNDEDAERIDSHTITILLMIKTVLEEIRHRSRSPVKTQVITEVMNSENLELISRTGVNDSIISYQMVSKVLAQVGENPRVLEVYEDLFSEEGAEIYLKPIELYLKDLPPELSFADLMGLAEKRGEILIGYRYKLRETQMENNFGVEINPLKGTLIQPESGDRLIVLSENEL